MKHFGYTLIELMVVLIILSLISIDIIRWSKEETLQLQAKQEGVHWFALHTAVKKYLNQYQAIPNNTHTEIASGVYSYVITDLRLLKEKSCVTDPNEQANYGEYPFLDCNFENKTPLFGYKYQIELVRNTVTQKRTANIRLLPSWFNYGTDTMLDEGYPLLLNNKVNINAIATALLTAKSMTYASYHANLIAKSDIQAQLETPVDADYGTVLTTIHNDAELDVFLRDDGENDMENSLLFEPTISRKQQVLKNVSRLVSKNTCEPSFSNPTPEMDSSKADYCAKQSNENALILGDQLFANFNIDDIPENPIEMFTVDGKLKQKYMDMLVGSDGHIKELFPNLLDWDDQEELINFLLLRANLAKMYGGNVMNSQVVIDAKTSIYSGLRVIGQISGSRFLDNDVDYNKPENPQDILKTAHYMLDPSGNSTLNQLETSQIEDHSDGAYYVDPDTGARLKTLKTGKITDDIPDDPNHPDYWKRFVIDPDKLTNLNVLATNVICDVDSLSSMPNQTDIEDLNMSTTTLVDGVLYDQAGNVIGSKCGHYKLDPSGDSVVQNLLVTGDLTVKGRLTATARNTFFNDMANFAVAGDPGAAMEMMLPTFVQKDVFFSSSGDIITTPTDCPHILDVEMGFNKNKAKPMLILIPQQDSNNVIELNQDQAHNSLPGTMDSQVYAVPIFHEKQALSLDEKNSNKNQSFPYNTYKKYPDAWRLHITSAVNKGQEMLYYDSHDTLKAKLCADDNGCQSEMANASVLAMTFCNFE